MTTTTEAPARLSPAWWALQLDVSESSVRRWIREGDLKATRYGRLVRISEADMASFSADARAGL